MSAIEAIWRIEQAKLIAGLARIVRDVGLAEELAQDALVAALSSGRSRASRTIPAPG
jgi:predicted RNA polymerase sigma factor